MNFNTISEYDAAFIKSKSLPPLLDYVRDVNHRFLKVDMMFMEESMKYIAQDGQFCVPHKELREKGVVTSDNSMKIRKLLTVTHEFEEGVDYICKVAEKGEKKGKPQKTYTLTPQAYRMCLIRSRNTKKYANYYITLENCVNRYDNLTTKFLNRQLTIKYIQLSAADKMSRRHDIIMWKLADLEKDISRKNRIGLVYLISDGRFTKVGSTYNLPKRLSSLQVANAHDLKVVGTIYCQDPNWLERHIHKDLDRNKLGVKGEWYNISLTKIKQMCEFYKM